MGKRVWLALPALLFLSGLIACDQGDLEEALYEGGVGGGGVQQGFGGVGAGGTAAGVGTGEGGTTTGLSGDAGAGGTATGVPGGAGMATAINPGGGGVTVSCAGFCSWYMTCGEGDEFGECLELCNCMFAALPELAQPASEMMKHDCEEYQSGGCGGAGGWRGEEWSSWDDCSDAARENPFDSFDYHSVEESQFTALVQCLDASEINWFMEFK